MSEEINLDKMVKQIFRIPDAQRMYCCDACGVRLPKDELSRRGEDLYVCEPCGDINQTLLRCPSCKGYAHDVLDGETRYRECTHGCGWTTKVGADLPRCDTPDMLTTREREGGE